MFYSKSLKPWHYCQTITHSLLLVDSHYHFAYQHYSDSKPTPNLCDKPSFMIIHTRGIICIHTLEAHKILAVWNCWRVDPSNSANRNVYEAQKVRMCQTRRTYFLHKAKHSRNSQKLYAPVTRQGIFLVVQYFFCDEIIWVVRSSPAPISLHHHLH